MRSGCSWLKRGCLRLSHCRAGQRQRPSFTRSAGRIRADGLQRSSSFSNLEDGQGLLPQVQANVALWSVERFNCKRRRDNGVEVLRPPSREYRWARIYLAASKRPPRVTTLPPHASLPLKDIKMLISQALFSWPPSCADPLQTSLQHHCAIPSSTFPMPALHNSTLLITAADSHRI